VRLPRNLPTMMSPHRARRDLDAWGVISILSGIFGAVLDWGR
jgi:hypothetical protein